MLRAFVPRRDDDACLLRDMEGSPDNRRVVSLRYEDIKQALEPRATYEGIVLQSLSRTRLFETGAWASDGGTSHSA
eukprot:2197139-Rhodomonas_salina.1